MSALTRAEVLEARRRPSTPRPAFIPERKGHVTKLIRTDTREAVAIPPRKEQAPCCQARLDDLGRPPGGFCTPECIRRLGNWRLVVEGKPIPPGGVPYRALTASQPTPKEDPRWA